MKTEEIKKMILQGETFETTTDLDVINIWSNKGLFVLELNGEVVKTSKEFSTISKKLNQLIN